MSLPSSSKCSFQNQKLVETKGSETKIIKSNHNMRMKWFTETSCLSFYSYINHHSIPISHARCMRMQVQSSLNYLFLPILTPVNQVSKTPFIARTCIQSVSINLRIKFHKESCRQIRFMYQSTNQPTYHPWFQHSKCGQQSLSRIQEHLSIWILRTQSNRNQKGTRIDKKIMPKQQFIKCKMKENRENDSIEFLMNSFCIFLCPRLRLDPYMLAKLCSVRNMLVVMLLYTYYPQPNGIR